MKAPRRCRCRRPARTRTSPPLPSPPLPSQTAAGPAAGTTASDAPVFFLGPGSEASAAPGCDETDAPGTGPIWRSVSELTGVSFSRGVHEFATEPHS
ncbi:hypothetical protein ACFC1R_21245 [Kitasatospora sp. NPDC056138]|uniref:hypothetical protein n=1 Tax=Kitasatospora sp. NPDC056138 TaxID=3345724 RepID=UPI0035D71A32